MENPSNHELSLLYKELFVIKPLFSTSESELTNIFNFDGNLLSPNNIALVENILKAIPNKTFSLESSFSINSNNISLPEIDKIVNSSSSVYFIFWGENDFTNANNIQKYSPIQLNSKWFILIDNSFELIKSKELKEKLWLAIKTVFK